jgi:hypothetical protein
MRIVFSMKENPPCLILDESVGRTTLLFCYFQLWMFYRKYDNMTFVPSSIRLLPVTQHMSMSFTKIMHTSCRTAQVSYLVRCPGLDLDNSTILEESGIRVAVTVNLGRPCKRP